MTKKVFNRLVPPVLLALAVALVWTYLTRDMYNYNLGFASVLGLNLFPLIGWTVSLTAGYIAMSVLFKKMGIERLMSQFVLFTIVCIVVVVALETIGYHVLGIQNTGTSRYIGLPVCDCLHAPGWMQLGYFLLGPVYWLMYTGLRLHASTVSDRVQGWQGLSTRK